ncbi:MAG: glycosyltransferase family 4 protein [Candidatus Peribacteraceae bacterium]|nr:glycosyltransferase family 4 protein [Candidatus Peribacteraceae bacterium]
MRTLLLISPYWKEDHRWMVSSVKLAGLWQRLGYRVVVVCMGHPSDQRPVIEGEPRLWRATSDQHDSTIPNHGGSAAPQTLEIHRIPDFFLSDPWNYGIAPGFAGKALRLAEEFKPDIIVVNKILFWSSFALLRLRLAGFKVLLTTDTLVGITWWPRGRFAKICAAIYAWTGGWLILKAATKVVFFHPQPPAILQRLGVAEKSTVIPTGIDLRGDQRTANSDQRKDADRRPQTADRSPDNRSVTVTYVGRLESVKGVDDFVAAALKVKQEHPELQIQVVGWSKENHPLVEAHKDAVTFTGLRHDIPDILSSTDIFVLPSYSEGLSNALMEAMTAGCACIASDVGGNAFLIQNGVSGFLFPAGDREALAAHIRRLIDDPAKRQSLGEGARKRIEERFSWEKVGEEYRKLFESFRMENGPAFAKASTGKKWKMENDSHASGTDTK